MRLYHKFNPRSVLSTNYAKDPTDPTSKDDQALKEWLVFTDKYYPPFAQW
jgi:branched-chain amino acid transport system substrate-binding protein